MAIIEITSAARCKDCCFLKTIAGAYKNGNIKISYQCAGPGKTNGQKRAKRDLVCEDWQITF